MSITPQFRQAYKTLNPAQKKAVDEINGPLIVSAGPGTGKTQVLAMRIANILKKTDTNPSSILALTFTDSAAKNMRQRLISLIGQPAYYVQISTFHSFCKGIIEDNPEYFLLDRDAQAIAKLEHHELLQQIVKELELEMLRPLNAPYFYIKEIIKAISDLKREGITLKKYVQLIEQEQAHLQDLQNIKKPKKTVIAKQEKKIAKNQDLYKIYQAYQAKLQQLGRYDFDDMIALVVEAFDKHELLLREYQENLLYFLVDEYQDTNASQNRILQQLASYWGDQANVFVVGDPNQAIYRFQGASVENILGFVKTYPNALQINLETGYRCPQEIYSQAYNLISHNTLTSINPATTSNLFLHLNKPLQSTNFRKTQLELYQAPSQILEAANIADKIRQLLDQGAPAEEIAVLYRNNADMPQLASVLAKFQIPFEIDGGDNILEAEHIQQLIDFLKTIHAVRKASELGLLYQILQYEWLNFNALTTMKLGRIAGKCGLSVYELIEQGFDQIQLLIKQKNLILELTKEEFGPISQFAQQIINWNQLDLQIPFTDWFEQVITNAGYLPWILKQDNKVNLLTSLNALYSQIKSLVYQNKQFKLAEFLEAIATMREHGIAISNEDFNITCNRVSLATVHKAKGREWQHVFLYNLIDGKWGSKRRRELIPLPSNILSYTDLSAKESNEDERRLFYVGLTRAKRKVYLSFPDTIIQDNYSKSTVGSVFLQEIDNTTKIKAPNIEQNQEELMVKLLTPTAQKMAGTTTAQRDFLQNLVDRFTLSVTALNTYLRDPAEFMNNFLLRVPRAKPAVMAFGSAVHFTLEQMYKPLLKNQVILSLPQVLNHFKQALEKEILSSDEFSKRLKYGKKILQKYYQFYVTVDNNQSQLQILKIEKFFGRGPSKTMLGDIALSGRIDRIDWLDQKKQTVTVVDYKTGRIKSVNEIEGKVNTKDFSERELSISEAIRGSYKRQLLFYKLLCELDRSFKPIVSKGVFDFVEPRKTNNKLVRREFELKDEDVELLKKLIKEVMKEIRGLEFLNNID